MSLITSYVRLYFQLFFEHDGSNPNITDYTKFEILCVPQGMQKRLLVGNDTRIYKMIPENCKNLFNKIKYFYEHLSESSIRTIINNSKTINSKRYREYPNTFSVKEMFDILTMTESGFNKKYTITTLNSNSSRLVDLSYYLVIDGEYVPDDDIQNKIYEHESELSTMLKQGIYYDSGCQYDKYKDGSFVGGMLVVQPLRIHRVDKDVNVNDYQVTFQIQNEIKNVTPYEKQGRPYILEFRDSDILEFDITNPESELKIEIEEKEFILKLKNEKEKLEEDGVFEFKFGPNLYPKYLNVKLNFVFSYFSFLNRKIYDLYQEYINRLPTSSKSRLVILDS